MEMLVTYPDGHKEVIDLLPRLQAFAVAWLFLMGLMVFGRWMERKGLRPSQERRLHANPNG